ncbi:MAG: hypothetical protein AYK18_13580 [Theionarchaea archaeon DG-70]|nr:MAG: hypothetical protein AYK18_13580 [Theionarchaea archaeon DG-70]
MVTTIQVTRRTKKELQKMKLFPRETYEEVIQRLIELSAETIQNIENALKDVKKGRIYSTEEVKKELDLI